LLDNHAYLLNSIANLVAK